MGYTIEIYRSRYSAIDPNIVHDYDEFDNDEHLIVSLYSHLVLSSLMELYGTKVSIKMPLYITSDIQKDFDFSRLPYIKHKDSSHITFSDGTKTLTFAKHKLKKYTRYEKKDMYVAFFKKKFTFSNPAMFLELKEYLEDVLDTPVEHGGIYQLTANMIDIMFRHTISAWSLQDIYDEDADCLFIRFIFDGDDDDSSSPPMDTEREYEPRDEYEEGLVMFCR